MNRDLNSTVQIIASQAQPAFSRMVAGTGWFPNADVPEGTIVTNAHVVNGATNVYIRLPCAHSTDISVQVKGISTDLDIAVLQLPPLSLERVKAKLGEMYDDTRIPTIEIGDSDKFQTQKDRTVVDRGYPLGTEYQQFTRGTFSGLKHAKEQVYMVSDAAINPGNSGGPQLNIQGQVVGMNTMKVRGATEINMQIPINRIMRVLPELLDNAENEKQVQKWLKFAQMAFKQSNAEPTQKQLEHVASMIHGSDPDLIKLKSTWETHNLGGYKKTSAGIQPVTFSDWYSKHIYDKQGSHALLTSVMEHIEAGNVEDVHKMRANGFKSFSCDMCAAGHCAISPKTAMGNIPPRVLHYPRLAFRTSNSTGIPTLTHYGNQEGIRSGVIVSDVVKGGLMHRSGLQKYDFIHNVTTPEGSFDIDDYGESWRADLQVSLPINDIIHRTKFGDKVAIKVVRGKELKTLDMDYTYLKQEFKPHIRSLDSLQDMPLSRQVANIAGITLTPLRLHHVMQFKLGTYMNPHMQNQFKIVVADLKVGSPAFHARNIMPGDVLAKINDQPVAETWDGFVQQMKSIEKTAVLESERGAILIL
jgi:S1-C subfamily serine protease